MGGLLAISLFVLLLGRSTSKGFKDIHFGYGNDREIRDKRWRWFPEVRGNEVETAGFINREQLRGCVQDTIELTNDLRSYICVCIGGAWVYKRSPVVAQNLTHSNFPMSRS